MFISGSEAEEPLLVVEGDISASGNIIGQSYIVRSTVTQITTSFSSGSTIFGDSSDDIHRFTGSLISTGNISGSGISTGSFGAGFFNNKVGIGTTGPSFRPLSTLHLKSGGTETGSLRFENSHDIVNMNFVDNVNDSDFVITYVGTGCLLYTSPSPRD